MANTTKKAVVKDEVPVNPAEINTKEAELNEVEYTIEYQKTAGAVIPVIDGVEHPELTMGYTSEADMKAGLELLKKALKGANGCIPRAMQLMYSAALNSAKNIHPDEQVEVDGYQLMIEYATKTIYTLNREVVATLEDLTCELPEEAIKALLVERAKTWIANREALLEEEYYDEDDYYDDYE